MQSANFILRTPVENLTQWIKLYAKLYPPPGCTRLHLDPNPPLFDWDEETRTIAATIYKVAPFGRHDPLFEFSAV